MKTIANAFKEFCLTSVVLQSAKENHLLKDDSVDPNLQAFYSSIYYENDLTLRAFVAVMELVVDEQEKRRILSSKRRNTKQEIELAEKNKKDRDLLIERAKELIHLTKDFSK